MDGAGAGASPDGTARGRRSERFEAPVTAPRHRRDPARLTHPATATENPIMPLEPPAAAPSHDPLPETVRELRRRWKPTRMRLAEAEENEGLRIRVHRSASWLEHVQSIRGAGDLDAILVFQWSAIEALFGRWDPVARRPVERRVSLPEFLSRIDALDRDGLVPRAIEAQRDVALRIFGDAFLAGFFWLDPGEERARACERAAARAIDWFETGRHRTILEQLLDRVGLLRDQVTTGSATCDGRLNRSAIARCCELMDALLPALLVVVIDHGAAHDWGPLCYPPQTSGAE